MSKRQILGITTAMALLPLLALAQPINRPEDVPQITGGVEKVVEVLGRISNYMLFGLLTIAGIFIIYAAYLYLTASGDAEKVKHASNVIIYAAVAIGVGLLSKVIVAIAVGLIK